MYKGSFGYLQKKRVFSLVKSILFLAAVLIIYFTALHHFHTNKNVFSIIAAVGALPTGRSIVETVMCFRARSASEKVRKLTEEIPGLNKCYSLYDLYLTSYERAYSLSHAAIGNGLLVGLTEAQDTDCRLCEQHISDMAAKDGIDGFKAVIYKDFDEYADALKELVLSMEKADSQMGKTDGQTEETDDQRQAGAKDTDARAAAMILSISV